MNSQTITITAETDGRVTVFVNRETIEPTEAVEDGAPAGEDAEKTIAELQRSLRELSKLWSKALDEVDHAWKALGDVTAVSEKSTDLGTAISRLGYELASRIHELEAELQALRSTLTPKEQTQ